MLVAGLALLGVAVYFAILTAGVGYRPTDRTVIDAMVALGFGASLISIFARLGGGIFTKGADVGGDLVGKVEAGIPEDDPRNPATIADNVGDNVGDCAGMAADLFETYAVTIVATMVLAAIYFAGQPIVGSLMIYPLAICAACVVTSIIGTFFVKLGANQSIMGALYKGFIATGVLSLIALYPITSGLLGMDTTFTARGITFTGMDLFWCGAVGLVVTAAIIVVTEYYTGVGYRPGSLDQSGFGDRPRHERDPGPCSISGSNGPAGADHHRGHHLFVQAGGPVRHRHRGHDDAGAGRHGGGARCLRSSHGQCRRHRRDGRTAEGNPQDDGCARRRRQHDEGRDQGLRHRLGGSWRARVVRGL